MIKVVASIEKTLNSRCSSGVETGSEKRHWGTFSNTPLPDSKINDLFAYCYVPQMSGMRLLHWRLDERLYVGFEKTKDPYAERLLNVESGMQQQAIYLACAAIGLGVCILNQGINGTAYGEKLATASFLIREMSPPYEAEIFTTAIPGNHFVNGKNLPPPKRDGKLESLPELQRLTHYVENGLVASDSDISQLLWAAKGRTPHYIRLHEVRTWGLTIPTWGGGQDYTSVYLLKDGKSYRYINLTGVFLSRKPTHDIIPVGSMNLSTEANFRTAIVLCQNEKTGRALWEVGYMLENIFFQARSLGISFHNNNLSTEEISKLANAGLPNAVAAVQL